MNNLNRFDYRVTNSVGIRNAYFRKQQLYMCNTCTGLNKNVYVFMCFTKQNCNFSILTAAVFIFDFKNQIEGRFSSVKFCLPIPSKKIALNI